MPCNHSEMGNDGTMSPYIEGDCPYCEINRLKAELEEEREDYKVVMKYYQDAAYFKWRHDIERGRVEALENLLAEARAEVERLTEGKANRATREHAELVEKVSRLKVEIKRLNTLLDKAMHDYFCDMSKRLAEARQEAAREILEHLRSATFWVDGPDTDVVRIEFIVEYINNTFKLEGVRDVQRI